MTRHGDCDQRCGRRPPRPPSVSSRPPACESVRSSASDDSDVDYARATLTVWHTKFDKSRLLALSASTLDALADYQRLRRRLVPSP